MKKYLAISTLMALSATAFGAQTPAQIINQYAPSRVVDMGLANKLGMCRVYRLNSAAAIYKVTSFQNNKIVQKLFGASVSPQLQPYNQAVQIQNNSTSFIKNLLWVSDAHAIALAQPLQAYVPPSLSEGDISAAKNAAGNYLKTQLNSGYCGGNIQIKRFKKGIAQADFKFYRDLVTNEVNCTSTDFTTPVLNNCVMEAVPAGVPAKVCKLAYQRAVSLSKARISQNINPQIHVIAAPSTGSGPASAQMANQIDAGAIAIDFETPTPQVLQGVAISNLVAQNIELAETLTNPLPIRAHEALPIDTQNFLSSISTMNVSVWNGFSQANKIQYASFVNTVQAVQGNASYAQFPQELTALAVNPQVATLVAQFSAANPTAVGLYAIPSQAQLIATLDHILQPYVAVVGHPMNYTANCALQQATQVNANLAN